MAKGYLLLENGTVIEGRRFGAEEEALGELVFTTAMTGYLETLTDPCYHGQMVVHTFPLIGNYGVIPQDFECPKPRLSAYILREWCLHPSNFRALGDLDCYLKSVGIPGLYGVDTRALARIIRDNGVMKAAILDEIPKDKDIPFQNADTFPGPSVAAVTCKKAHVVEPFRALFPAETPRVALWDFGVKNSFVTALAGRGCRLYSMPAASKAEEILACNPHGIFLTNGPGNPEDNGVIIAEINKAIGTGVPVFAVGLGHQLLALAKGGETTPMSQGHRGGNQPVKELETNRLLVTNQNHGYAVAKDALPKGAVLCYANANDGTVEGLTYSDIPAFSVQFHPSGGKGATETGFLFDSFVDAMKRKGGMA